MAKAKRNKRKADIVEIVGPTEHPAIRGLTPRQTLDLQAIHSSLDLLARQCDLGDDVSGDGCSTDCRFETLLPGGGTLNIKPDIRIEREAPGMALVDGDNGMGHLVMRVAAEKAIVRPRRRARSICRLSTQRGASSIGLPSSVYTSQKTSAVPGSHGVRRSVFRSGFSTKSP